MSDDASRQRLERLSLAAGAPGAEDEVRAIVLETLRDAGTIRYDRLGSLLCEKKGEADSPRVTVDSHLDEVAFMVQRITDEGRLTFVPLGGWWGHVLLGQRVDIVTERGKVPGVIGSTPPHFLTTEERRRVLELDKMYVDVGASNRDQATGLGIRLGDPIVPAAEFREMAVEGVLSGKALDNRLGVGLMCDTMLALRDRRHPNTVIGVAAVQEEVGLRGAGTASEIARPDVAIVLECTPADDLPGGEDRQGVLGGGPQVRLFDPTAISNRRLVRFVETVAEECGVRIQPAVRRSGGTNAGAIHRSHAGVPTVVVAVPGRYIHSHVSLMQWSDYVGARTLALELVLRLDAAHVEEFTRFG
jgi:putative aminopeptidase FrvX